MKVFAAIVLLLILSTCHACRFQQYVSNRRKDISYRTRKLRPKLINCFSSSKLGMMYKSFESIVDFVVLDTEWFTKTEDQTCGKAAGRHTPTCWKESVKQLLRPNSTLLRITLKCMKQSRRKKANKQQETVKDGKMFFRKTCLQQNKILDKKYKKCIQRQRKRNGDDKRSIDFDSILAFMEDHWMCDSSIPGSCTPKGNICHPPSWLRRLPTFLNYMAPLNQPLAYCNNEIFPRLSTEYCKHWLPTFGTQKAVITSPGFPNQINHEFDCVYHLQAQYSFGLKIKVEVDTESCCDFVTLYLKNSTILAKLSGNVTRTFEVGSNTNEIFVQYHTDESGASKGFRITRNNVCKFQHMANDRVLMIHAPTYAYPRKPILQKFGEEMDCQWTITAQADQQVSLYLHRIKMNVSYEQLEILDGSVSLGYYTIAKASEIPVTSQHGSLTIKYHSDSTVSGNGFRASYHPASYSCGGNYNASDSWQNVTVKQQSRVGYFPNLCFSQITSSPGYAVILNISSTNRREHQDNWYHYNWVEIYDGPKLLQKFTNETHNYVSSENRLAISYSTHDWKGYGYRAFFKRVPCNVTYNLIGSASMKLASPDYESFPFNIYQRCTYTLLAQPGKKIRMSLRTFSNFGYVQIFNGDMYFGRADRVNKTYRLTSTGSTIQLHYTAPKSHSATSRGFVATYKQYLSTTHRLGLSSETCDWIITTSSDKQILLKIFDINLDEKKREALYVYDQMISLGKYSGSRSNLTLVSSSNVVRIRLNRCQLSATKGFVASCKEVVNSGWNDPGAFGGIISSQTMCNSSRCESDEDNFWNLQAGYNFKRIELNIIQLHFNSPTSYLEVMENSKTVAKLEGNFSLPQRFISSKDVLRIYFHSNDGLDQFAGNVTQVCSRELTARSKYKTISFLNRRTPEEVNCRYNFLTSPESRIQIYIFIHLQFFARIQVLDGDNFLYNFQGSYLTAYEEKAAVVLTSISNTLTILHNMESRSYSSGFSVTYRKFNPLLPMQVKSKDT
ncbi:cubilin-like isoform X2 [Clavelina lepadiformis]|uniref:cubilin-like isoform X2 n=1 Tax=Clavelina lepadiformis TaxID=159417 RepID=UPI004042070A